ncbi:hypothetical protein FQZ97_1123710 [compost metagenome]
MRKRSSLSSVEAWSSTRIASREARIWSSMAPSAISSSRPGALFTEPPEAVKRGSRVRCSTLRDWFSQAV